MQIIYPDDYSNSGKPDETFAQEYFCARDNGIHCLLLSSEMAAMGKYQFSSSFKSGIPVIWRGWMLKMDEYKQLHDAVNIRGGEMLESPEEYIRNHHIVGWYDQCKRYTPDTILTTDDNDFDALTAKLQWPAYFVKDYVKSLTTSRGSIAKNAKEIKEIIQLIAHFRGEIEGGVCLRYFENILAHTERRYFVLNKQVFSADDYIPELIREISRCIDTPFFSIDVAKNSEGNLRLIEIGDGQVSDIKEWSVEKFINIFIKKL